MIEVSVKKDGEEIAHLRIENITPERSVVDGFADYKVKYAVERGAAVGTHTRIIYGFPRRYYNVLGLVLQSLNALNEKDLKLERDFDPDETPATTNTSWFKQLLSGRPRRL